MTPLVKLISGSRLYGTNVSGSDTDFRGVYLSPLRDCLLNRVKDTVTDATEEDTQSFSLQYFLQLASQGQSIAIEMLSAPDGAVVIQSAAWMRLRAERKRFYTRNIHSFLGFAKSQSGKYSSRAERLNEVEAIFEVFKRGRKKSIEDIRLSEIWDELPESTNAIKGTNPRNTNADKRAYIVCGRELQSSVTIWHAAQVIQTIRDGYGERVRNAKDGNIDWKSLAHAFRVSMQAEEIVETGDLIYPLKQADYLRSMRLGQIDFISNGLDQKLDDLIAEVQVKMDASSLPERVDQAWVDQLILDIYREHYNLPPL